MVDKAKKKSILKKILNSNAFVDSKISSRLLSYLVDCSIKNEQPKEITIAIEVFERDHTFNPAEDSLVRYNIHYLRKRLDAYYQDEGKFDKIRLSIPKGHYIIEFSETSEIIKKFNFYKNNPAVNRIIALVTFLVLLTSVVILLYINSSLYNKLYLVDDDDPVWNDFYKNGKPTTIVYGDYYLLKEFRADLGRYQEIRDYKVNSDKDIDAYRAELPDNEVVIPDFNMLPHHLPQNLYDLCNVLYAHHSDVSLSLSSSLSWDNVKSNNIIYFGKFLNLRILERFISKLHIRHPEQKDLLVHMGENEDTLKVYHRYRSLPDSIGSGKTTGDYYNRDFALIAKIPGPQNNSILIFAGIGHISLVESVKMFTNPDLLEKFEDEIIARDGEFPQFFELICEVSGFKRTGLNVTVKHFGALSNDYSIE